MPAPKFEDLARVEAELLAPGAPFELEWADVLGERMQVFKRRPRSLGALLAGARGFGAAEALVFTGAAGPGPRLSFDELLARVASVAAALRARGIDRGDRVAILAANCPEWIVAFWATVSLGAVAVGLNAWWAGPEIAHALADADPKLLICDVRRAERLDTASARVPTIIIERDFSPLWRARGEALPAVDAAEDDPAVILYTRGTTGRSKGALQSHRNVLALVGCNFFHGTRMRLAAPPPADAPPPSVLVTSPLFHVSGLHNAAVICLAGGIRSIWLTGRFDAAHALATIEAERVTSWGYTQTLLHRLIEHPDVATRDLSSLRQLGGGGSPIPPALQSRARAALPGARTTMGVGYGQTECASLATLNPGDELCAFPRSVGRPLPTVALEIRDPDGRPVPDGVTGEVTIRSPLVMLEYWRNPAATADVLGPGRWLRTGDLGTLEGGRLTLTSRSRDLIIRGGENIYPAEIEQRLSEHPDVAESAVIGVAHESLGQEVKAVVVARQGKQLDLAALAEFVRAGLADFKVPAHWELRTTPLPRNAVGKILKHALDGDGTVIPD
ncbi:MAG: acyl--CoA ligase [Deltaproteobacteria bacterium]|nr:acyl--CoA ligase [Deltaproteobacteria bacterium]